MFSGAGEPKGLATFGVFSLEKGLGRVWEILGAKLALERWGVAGGRAQSFPSGPGAARRAESTSQWIHMGQAGDTGCGGTEQRQGRFSLQSLGCLLAQSLDSLGASSMSPGGASSAGCELEHG